MHKPLAILSAFLLLLAGCQSTPDAFRKRKSKTQPEPIFPLPTERNPQNLSPELQALTHRLRLPGMAAAAVDIDGVIAIGAAGVRKADAIPSVTITDKFHIGSCTKSMTALLAARLVDAGFIKWDTTLAQTFPGYIYQMQPQLKPVTLRMLLANRSGQSSQDTNDLLLKVLSTPRPLMEQKAILTRGSLTLKPTLLTTTQPSTSPHTQPTTLASATAPATLPSESQIPYAYSNVGYFLAGSMLEATTGQSWSKLMETDIFAPLGLESAGFGPGAQPGFGDAPDQPWGHRLENDRLIPVAPGPDADNPEILGPAGAIHMDVQDFASYAQFHLTNLRNQVELITPESAHMLYEPFPGPPLPNDKKLPGQKPGSDIGYALGMVVFDHETLGRVWFHTGSNNMNSAIFLIAPTKNIAAVVMTNAARPDTQDALIAYAILLAQQHATP